MIFNDTKFELLRYGENKFLKESTNYLGLSGKKIEKHEHVRDLGVVMSSDASFRVRIHQVAATARKYKGKNTFTYFMEESNHPPFRLLLSTMVSP